MQRDVQTCQEFLRARPQLQGSFKLEEEGVQIVLCGLRVSCMILDRDSYPNTCALLGCEDPAYQPKLEALSEKYFTDKAPLPSVLSKVLELLGHTEAAKELSAQASSGKGGESMEWEKSGKGGEGSDKMDEDEEQEEEEGDEDEGGSDDGDGDESDQEDRELTIECGKRQGRWEKFEQEQEAKLRAAQQEGGLAISSEKAVAQRHQIFEDGKCAFLMLSKELLDIFKRQSLDMFVDSEGDDVFQWGVELSSFADGSGLAQDMREIQRRYSYSSLKLKISFMRGLHPFFPASVEIVRPFLKDWMIGATASHPMLQIANWDPLKPLAELIAQLKGFLEAHARVDLGSPLNDITRFPHSSYPPSQRCLARLEALTGHEALCIKDTSIKQLYACRYKTGREASRPEAAEPSTSNGGDVTMGEGGASKKRTRNDSGEEATEKAAPGKKAEGSSSSAQQGAKPGEKPKEEKKTYWAAGTGYGTGGKTNGPTWDPKKAEAAQQARDAEIQSVVLKLTEKLEREIAEGAAASTGGAGDPTTQGSTASSSSQQQPQPEQRTTRSRRGRAAEPTPSAGSTSKPSKSAELRERLEPYLVDQGEEAEASSSASPQESVAEAAKDAEYARAQGAEGCMAAVRASCLLPFLCFELRTTSFSDMCSRAPYYHSLLRTVQELIRHRRWAAELLTEVMPAGYTLLGVLEQLAGPASQFIKLTQAEFVKRSEEESSQRAEQQAKGKVFTPAKAPAEALRAMRAHMRLALLAEELHEVALAVVPKEARTQAAAGPSAQAATDEYAAVMKPLQMGEVTNLAGTVSGAGSSSSAAGSDETPRAIHEHAYRNEALREGVAPSERVSRLGKEIVGLMSDLPLNASSSVFVRVDEDKMMLWRFLLTGPDDTPYAGGCFIFDIYFPPTYPAVCPKVLLKTTGGGSVRFNPNLYNCGKVCLSLLGTWEGAKGEGWVPNVSSALQLFVSIQSLIFVEEPYFNEPGYERSIGTPQGTAASRSYNVGIREGTIRYAMLDLLKHPPPEFKPVIINHFKLRRAKILSTVDAWISDASTWNQAHASTLRTLREQLVHCFDKLDKQ